jgi:hypothetical protein
MNNALLIQEEEPEVKKTYQREEAGELVDTIEALKAVLSSAHWKVLQKFIFEVELNKSKSRLESESDTTEIFRLQGELRTGKRYDLEHLLKRKLEKLESIKSQLNTTATG